MPYLLLLPSTGLHRAMKTLFVDAWFTRRLLSRFTTHHGARGFLRDNDRAFTLRRDLIDDQDTDEGGSSRTFGKLPIGIFSLTVFIISYESYEWYDVL